MSLPPEIGLRIRSDHERLAFLLPDFGFVEPHHDSAKLHSVSMLFSVLNIVPFR